MRLMFILIPFVALLLGCSANNDQTADRLPTPDEQVVVDEMPVLKEMPPPVYSDAARNASVEGTVQVQALVGKDGHVIRAIIENAEEFPLLASSALSAVQKAVFTPAMQNGKPVAVWVKIPIRFRLHEEAG